MLRILVLILATIFSMPSFAKPVESFIPVAKNLSLYVRYEKALEGKTTLVILNGLTHSTDNWNDVLKNLKLNGIGLLQIDLAGQGRTLANHGQVNDVIRYQDQELYVLKVLSALHIDSKITLLSLSYGGGISTYFAGRNPAKIEKLILLAPYTEPVPDQDKWIKEQVAATRLAFPYNPSSDDELYDYFLRQLVYSTYPAADSTLLTTPYKLEAVFRMTQGIRKLKTARYTQVLPEHSLYLIGGSVDQVVKPEVLDKFWSQVPNSAKASRLVIENEDHDLITYTPKTIAWWVELILANDPQTLTGEMITVAPK